MFAHDLYQSAKAAFAKEAQELKDRLAAGRWHGEAAGRELVGQIAGLEKATALLIEEMQKLERLEEDE